MSLPTSPLNNPKVSIIMAAYNRADTLPRAINSVLCQDMPDWELIIVDDGSTDNTRAIIESYLSKDSRIRAAFHECNLHVNAAKNTGFDLMHGEWFTTLDSDDEMVPSALSSMLRLLKTVDSSIDAITCNCLDSTTGKFSGHGLDHDQWIDFETLMTRCSGEHWGLTKRSLLGDQRFNSKMRGVGGGDTVVENQQDSQALLLESSSANLPYRWSEPPLRTAAYSQSGRPYWLLPRNGIGN